MGNLSTIPNPDDAERLRRVYSGNPVVRRAVESLRTFGGDLDAASAARLLVCWAHFAELSLREVQAVLAMFVLPVGDRFPFDESSSNVLAAAERLDPADTSPEAAYVREVAQSVIEHRDAARRFGGAR